MRHALPDTALTAWLSIVQRRWRLRSMAQAIAAGGATFALALILTLTVFTTARTTALWISMLCGAAAFLASVVRSPQLSGVAAARVVEQTTPGLDNLIVTAAELEEHPRPVR